MKDPNSSPREPALDGDVRRTLDEQLGLPLVQEDALIARAKARVMGLVRAEAQAGHTVRASHEGWQIIAPGVERKMLWATATEQSCLIRAARGASLPAHAHRLDEECLVLEGTLRFGSSLVLHAGDFHVGRKGSTHEVASTDTGVLVYLRGALEPA
jgi:mannose-6-phosphate isomerase-like protein (cupin superfamily)